jgi:hypothetical protein
VYTPYLLKKQKNEHFISNLYCCCLGFPHYDFKCTLAYLFADIFSFAHFKVLFNLLVLVHTCMLAPWQAFTKKTFFIMHSTHCILYINETVQIISCENIAKLMISSCYYINLHFWKCSRHYKICICIYILTLRVLYVNRKKHLAPVNPTLSI